MSEQEDPKRPDNVTPIEKARKRKKEEAESSEAPKVAELYRAISDAIKRAPSLLPAFPARYEVLEPELGVRLPLLIAGDGSVTIVKPSALANAILSYCENELAGRKAFALGPRQAKEAADYYLMTATPTPPDAVKIVRWAGEEGMTYRRLPWRREVGDTPTWDALIGRMTNADAFIAWVGSLFFEESSLHSYVWLYGGGGDGKGAINRFLARVFGSSYRSKQPPGSGQFTDKFWTYGILGARLVVFPDCDDYSFVSRGLFKSLTGGDPVDLQAKGQMSFTSRLSAKYLILSNEKPSISSEKADMRRIIYCTLNTAPTFDSQFEEKLWEEGGAFLSICCDYYLSKYPTHSPIESASEEISYWIETLEEPFHEAFSRAFELDKDSFVTPSEMQRFLKFEWPRQRGPQVEFIKFLHRVHGVEKKGHRVGDISVRRYQGIKMKADLGCWQQ